MKKSSDRSPTRDRFIKPIAWAAHTLSLAFLLQNLVIALLLAKTEAFAQGLTISGTRFELDGRLSLQFITDTNSYYTLFRGVIVTNISQPIDMILGARSLGQLTDPAAAANSVAFYLIRQVPLDHPLDTDGD